MRVPTRKGAETPPPELQAAMLVRGVEKMFVVDLDPKGSATTDAARVAPLAKSVAGVGGLVVALRDSEETRAAIAKEDLVGFTVPEHAGVVYASSEPVVGASAVVVVKRAPHARILKDTGEERFVLGVVLEPDVVDAQNDTYSADEVRKAAHRWMESNQAQLGKQHSEIVTGKLKVLESYVAPADFAVGEQTVKKGAWVMAIRVVDDDLWTAVKKGSFTGFSIGGTAIRTPVDATT